MIGRNCPVKKVHVNDLRAVVPQCHALGVSSVEFETPYFVIKKRGDYYTYEPNNLQFAVLTIVDEDKVVLIRTHRPILGDMPLEIPAGGVEQGETIVEAAQRELREETGIFVEEQERFQPQLPLASVGNRFPLLDSILIVHCTYNEYAARTEHDNETYGVYLYSIEEIQKLIIEGEIYTALPIAVLSRYIFEKTQCPRS